MAKMKVRKSKSQATPPKPAPPRPLDDIKKAWANAAVQLGDQERILVKCNRQHGQALEKKQQLHAELDNIDAEFAAASEYYAANPPALAAQPPQGETK